MSDERIDVPTAVYTHNEKGHREDVHRPSAINPGDYEYKHVKVNRKDRITGGPAGTCHHCGKAIVWEVVWLHMPSGNTVTFGETCTQILGMSNDRIEHEMVLLKRQAENEREDEKRKMVKEERTIKFRATEPEVHKFLTLLDENESFDFLVDMRRSMEQWGSLTERQVESVKKCMKARFDYNARKMAEAAIEVIPTTELEEGRRVVEGEVVSHKWVDSDYSDTRVHKMLVKQADGNKVWGSVPRDISDYLYRNDEQENRELRGLKVSFTGTVSQSKDDEHFGFFSRPSKAKVIV